MTIFNVTNIVLVSLISHHTYLCMYVYVHMYVICTLSFYVCTCYRSFSGQECTVLIELWLVIQHTHIGAANICYY